MPLNFFGSKSTISHFGERFRDGQYSLVSFLFAVLITVPPCPMESAALLTGLRGICGIWLLLYRPIPEADLGLFAVSKTDFSLLVFVIRLLSGVQVV